MNHVAACVTFSRRSVVYICVIMVFTITYPVFFMHKPISVLPLGFPIKRASKLQGMYQHPSVFSSALLSRLSKVVPWGQTSPWYKLELSEHVEKPVFERFTHCKRLIEGDRAKLEIARMFMVKHQRLEYDELDFIRKTEDCSQFILNRGYILDASEDEKLFPLAFSVVFYKDIGQMERLLRAIYRPHNIYCLHVDHSSSRLIQEAAMRIASCLPNVFLSSKAARVRWGTYTVLEPELICMNDLFKNKTWKYFINLTGQEFPLKTNLQLVQILSALNGSNDIDCTTNQRDSHRWYNNFAPPHRITPLKGNVHVAVCRGFIDYVLHSPVAADILRWVRYTEVPDETYFATLNHNPHLGVPGAYLGPPNTDPVAKPYISRFKNWGTNWKDGSGRYNFYWPCKGKRVRTICIFGVGDLPLLTSRKELFANKFFIDFQPLVLDCMEEWLWNLTMDEYRGVVKLDLSFYRSLNAVRSHITS